MNKTIKAFSFLLVLLLTIGFTSCNGGDNGGDNGGNNGGDNGGDNGGSQTPQSVTVINKDGSTSILGIVYGSAKHDAVGGVASEISSYLYLLYEEAENEVDFEFKKYSQGDSTENKIVYGRTDDAVSTELADAIDAYPEDSHVWGILYKNGVIALYANGKIAVNEFMLGKGGREGYIGLGRFVSSDGSFVLTDGEMYVEEITAAKYQTFLDEDAAKEAEKEEEERKKKVQEMQAELSNFKDSDFDPNGLGITEKLTAISTKTYAKPIAYPTKGEHPRVMFTADMIPGIKQALANSEYKSALSLYQEYLSTDISNGILGDVVTTSTYSYNYSAMTLCVIRAKAFNYAVYGNELDGYEAICSILNFMRTLDYNYKQIDQTRDYGSIMYTAACVYDWCYDLLTEADKRHIILGVEHVVCRGTCDEPSKSSFGGVKMEIGFPPTTQGAVTGHGCEMQLLRNYLSFSVAIYDEFPDWYDLCAGRFYQEYIEPRSVYYSAGLYPQGTQYNAQRFHCDLYAAVIMKAATGSNPFNEEDMRSVVYGLFGTVTDAQSKGTFFVGDIRRTSTQVLARAGECAMIASFLFNDPVLRGIAKWRENGYSIFTSGNESLTPTEFFILASDGMEFSPNGIHDVPVITYNGGWYGQIIVRESWRDDAAVVLMKVQERTTANHDHAAAGTFQIYYKGMLTGDMGDYAGDVYGSVHCKYFLRSTVAHNGLLIYDKSAANSLEGYYVGGQRQGISETSSLESWLTNNTYDTGDVTGYSYQYTDDGDARYAYIAGDITKAYELSQANFVGRSMLTVYTDDPDCPMVFFVFDRIEATSADHVKKFLLQIPVTNAPVIDENNKTVTLTNGKGKLVLTNIIGADSFEAFGGSDENGNRLNYQINGKQLDFSTAGEIQNRDSWGRVELVQDEGEKLGNFLNVIYVTDEGKEIKSGALGVYALDVKSESERLFEGARLGNVLALFANGKNRVTEAFTFETQTEGATSCYIGGLYAGSWKVSVDGTELGTLYSTAESGMITFDIQSGSTVTVTPGEDIRPSNSGEVTYVTSGGEFANTPSQFYPLGKETELTADIKRGADIFGGWYLDSDCTERIYAIPENAPESLTLYAKWHVALVNEDYSRTEIDTETGVTTGGFIYNIDKKPDVSFVTDPYRKALRWNASQSGPYIISQASYVGGKSIASLPSNQVCITVSLALDGTNAPMDVMFRVRDDNKGTDLENASTIYLAYLYGGALKLGDKNGETVLNLSSKMQTVSFVIDFEALKIVVYDSKGEFIAEKAISVPDVKEGMSGEEWRSCFKGEIINLRAQSAGSIIVGGISVVEGDKPVLTSDAQSNNVIYVANGGSFTSNVSTDYTPGTAHPLATNIVKDGFVFDGWYLDSAFTQKTEAVPADYEGEYPVYAKWVAHRIVYNTDGGAFLSTPDTAYTPGEAKTLATNITKDGYAFGGWFADEEFTVRITELPTDAYDLFIVYAKWTVNGNYIIFETNGGVLSGADKLETGELAISYQPGTSIPLPTGITKSGCTFLGWYTSKSLTAESKVDELPASATGEYTVYAKWAISFISEDYSESAVNTTTGTTVSGIRYSIDKTNASSFITDNEKGQLTWTASDGGPHITVSTADRSIASMTSNVLSLKLTMALKEGESAFDFYVRLRDKGGCSNSSGCNCYLLYSTGGAVYLGDKNSSVKLFDLTTEMQSANVVIDFEALMLYAYKDGEIIDEYQVVLPSLHTTVTGEEWRALFLSELFNMRAGGKGAVVIDEIVLAEGNLFA